VCGKQTGHAEVVAITFDPKVITFKDLLDVFFTVGWPRCRSSGAAAAAAAEWWCSRQVVVEQQQQQQGRAQLDHTQGPLFQ
jgi:peptide methionine sulfoxide reductase MsrA